MCLLLSLDLVPFFNAYVYVTSANRYIVATEISCMEISFLSLTDLRP